ncbi:MAG TPA: membrane protein insertase YidC [Candidatus Acidoferrales bacterium]|jgi:YidC/Oxa1 family membrane protein insertase|nr:membrane protein insertase YidC [Candidatus Acidoferrales bacterium]
MDKTGIIVVSLCVVLLGLWMYKQAEDAKALAQWQLAHPTAQATNNPAANGISTNGTAAGATSTNGTSTGTAATGAAASAAIFSQPATGTEQTITLTNGSAIYTFTSRGGGLQSVALTNYPETISARWKGQIHHSDAVASLNTHAPVPMLAVLGDPGFVGDGNFTLTPLADGVHAEKVLADGLVIAKDFHLSSNYLVNVSISLKNTSSAVLNLMPQEIVAGTATPMDADDTGSMWGAMWCDGTNVTDSPLLYFTGGGVGCSRGSPKSEIRGGTGNVMWVSAHNQFFAILAMPAEAASEMVARSVALPRFQDAGTATNSAAPQGIQTALVFPAHLLQPGATVTRDIAVFAGPKELRTLAVIAEQRANHADLVMNFGTGFSSFWGVGTFFAKLLLSGMNLLHDVTKLGYGWVIVLITVIIRLAFWPLTAKSTRSMKKMQALGPEVAALKEKYKDDVQKFTQKQMELWKKNGVSPVSGCLPMLVQMPVFIGFFTMIRSAIELRGASFLWATDLSKPDTIFMIPGITFLPSLSTPEGLPFNLLPLLMVSVMLWQSHMTPTSPGMDPAQQKMMRWIPAIFILLFYNYSSGLALYMTVSTLLGILQMKVTKMTSAPAPEATPALTGPPKKKK